MNPASQTLIIGIFGIVATLISSGLGHYFTARARTAPLRQQLYSKQIDIAVEITRLIGKVRVFSPIILDPDSSQFKEQALLDLRETVRDLSELSDTGAALLPTELWIELRKVNGIVVEFLVDIDDGEDVSWFPEALTAHATKTALMTRAYLGVDELSEQSVVLFTRRKRLSKIAGMKPEEIVESVRDSTDDSPPPASAVSKHV